MLVTILIFLLILSVLVIVHEAGHMLAAKSGGIRVDEFGLGFPPRIKKLFSWKGTDFTLNWLPFGGFVKIFGENPTGDERDNAPDSFNSKSKRRQIFVLAAGVMANFLLAWLLFSIVLMLGIEGETGFVQRGLASGVWHGLLTTGKITWLTLVAIWDLFAGIFGGHADLSGVVGPVGLVSIVGTVKTAGLSYVLYFMALISVNLGIINLLPLPALDGGRIALVLFEKVRGKKISPKLFNTVNLVSFGLLILLMILITVRDVRHLI